MKEVLLWLITFTIVYLIYLCLVILRKKQLVKFEQGTEMRYLKGRYHISISKDKMKAFAHLIALSNAFIIATTVSLVSFINPIILKLLIGFVILLPLILIVYHLIGTIYRKK